MTSDAQITVTVVIPTFGRPSLLRRAIVSVLQQTRTDFELVVVVDGTDPKSVTVLEAIEDDRIVWIQLPGASGSSGARNAGCQKATGEWIAFLDDDDEWLPTKLEVQLASALASPCAFPIVSTRIIVRSGSSDLHWPRRTPGVGEPISEYLFCRSGLFSGDGQFQTSAILARRSLMLLCPFNSEVRKHDDTEWYLTVAARSDVEFIVAREPLTIWHQSSSVGRVSQSGDWTSSLQWARRCRSLMTTRAYSSFVLSAVAAEAAEAASIRGVVRSYYEALRFGRPRLLDLVLPIMMIIIPRTVRQQLRGKISGARSKKLGVGRRDVA